jgi:hypothetical protein
VRPAGESIAAAHLLLLLAVATAWSRQLAKLALHPYSPAWVGRYPTFVLYAGFWTYVVWLMSGIIWLLSVRTASPLVVIVSGAAWCLDGLVVTFLLVLAARRHRAPSMWTQVDYDRFMAADSPRWWRREQARRSRAAPRPEDLERMRQLEDAILGSDEVDDE